MTSTVGGVSVKIIERIFLTYAVWFFIGVFCYVKREQLVPMLKHSIPMLVVVYVFNRCLPINIPGYYANILVGILLPLIVIGGVLLAENQDILRSKLRDFFIPLDCA